ncbi:N-acetylmuramoyl-L-alanine amidase [Clostridium botulinum]|uniref:N-acetylmuramoyl-L-alanine amidase n=1 Tax=Clostridium botulinum TaxID=1491 RepID=A0A846I7V3_CLOBO|nr:N-acetylmuramoyl-L-alanine amidase [Clostridium botulinum]RFM19140.1 N-acetylmuramoyl-L-alanine amidase [Clostridium botulinum]
MKIGIDCGHTMSRADYGAVGIKAESNLTREVGIKVISKLQALGHTVVKCYKDTCSSLNDSLSYRTNTANNNNVDLYVSIHFNCYNGSAYGTEIFTYGGKSFTEASRVLNNICALGYTNRGLKDGSGLYVLKHTKAKSMLIECCLCDNASDMNKFNVENMANAIVKGLVGKTTPTTSNSKPSTSKPVQTNKKHPLINQLYAEMSRQDFNTLPTCRQGARGNITKTIQQMLINIGYPVGSYGADRVFGNGTVTAIKALQRDCNLSVDGVVGKETWGVLFRNLK